MAVSASAQLTLVSTTGTAQNPVYNYDVTVTNTGTTPVGTFWMGWTPGADYLPSTPSHVSNPSGWTDSLNGPGNSVDGASVEWVASSISIAPGQSLGGFDFSTTDNPAALGGNSPSHPGSAALTSFVYSGGPFSDAGFMFVAAAPSVPPPDTGIATSTTLSSSSPVAKAGDQVVLTATVTPSNPGAAPSGTVNFTIGGTSIGSSPLQNDGTATLTVTNLSAGPNSIVATYSGDGTYTGSASGALVETIQAPPALSAAIAKSTLPGQLVSGAPAKGVVNLSIANNSGSAVKGKSTFAIYASTGDGIDESSVLLGQVTKTTSIAAGKQLSTSVPLHITAAMLTAGSYRLFARATDPSGSTADSAPGGTLDVAAPFVALTEARLSSSLPASTPANGKSHGAVVLSVTNSGNVTTSATTACALYATASGAVDGSAVQLAAIALPLRIKPGKTGRAVIPLKQIPAIANGEYTVVAQLTDQNGGVSSVIVGPFTITA
jgi:Big-like domain-containing protein